MTIDLDASDIDAGLRLELEKALKRRARKNGTALGNVLKKAQLSWTISCDLSE